VLVELRLVEQRYKAVLEVLEGAQVTDVARRYGVARQTVHDWLRRYGDHGLAGLADRSSRPESCPHQMAPEVEAQVVELRLAHPAWGPETIRYELGKSGPPPPGRSSIYRALVRHGLVEGKKRKRGRADYRRFERSRAMELWQMDVVGGFHLSDRTELKAVTGLDDHSRYCVSAHLVLRATSRPTCQALKEAMATHGVPDAVMTDNAKTFTSRFGPGPGPVLFDRICAENGVRHILTAPYSPTTNGKVERFHKTLRAEFFGPNDYRFATIEQAQAALDEWVGYYNTKRPHQAIGMVAPIERFKLAVKRAEPADDLDHDQLAPGPAPAPRPPGVHRWVDPRGKISLSRHHYHVGAAFAGEAVEVVCRGGLVDIFHAGVLVATHAERRNPKERSALRPRAVTAARRPAAGPSVTRTADGNGSVSFAGSMYRAGRAYARRQVQVALVAGSVQLSVDDRVVRVHAARHDPAKEHGAFAMPKGKPRKSKPSLAG
jgi:transposase InsO family protein